VPRIRAAALAADRRVGLYFGRDDTVSLVDAAISAFLQVALLGGVPFLGYLLYQRWRHKRTFRDVAGRAGLRLGEPRYLVYSLAFALVGVVILVLWSPPLEPFTRQGSAQRQFVGLGLGVSAITSAFLNGVVQTGFAEELLFRGLIAGSLSRRLPLVWANLAQAMIFLLPHLAILLVAPELGGILPVVFAGALLFGWVRIKSGSIIGPWLMHASGNVTMAMMVAIRTSV
jgi:membrane protease YdiL (CAAX protease family)